MKRWIVMMLVLGLMFVGCTKQEEAVESAKEAVESAKEAVTGEAGEEDPDVASCLQLVSQAKFDDALPLCLAALKKHPDNDEVKGAVEKAQAEVGDAAAAATDAAQGAQEDAAKEVQGAMDEATGSL